MKEKIIQLLGNELDLAKEDLDNLVEIPSNDSLGDYAFPCFSLAKKEKKSPLLIAEDLAKSLRKKIPREISNVDSKSGYVNFFIDKKIFAEEVLKKSKSKNFGENDLGKGKKVGIEYPGPNTNKALHIGHLRNIAIGEAVSRIGRISGNKVFHMNIFNDRGILISKSMIGYERYAKGETPESKGVKGDKFVGDLYSRFSQESKNDASLDKAAQEKLISWENGDKDTVDLWKKMNSWAYRGMQETFDLFGLSKIDKNYYESEMYDKGKEIVQKGLKKGIFGKTKDGAVKINLDKEKLGEKILLRADGTSLYITQDLYLADKRVKDFDLDSSYYVVGNDQDYHFKVLFTILEKLGLKKDWRHLSYGMVELPTGKMKSREGTAVSADDLISKTRDIAEKRLRERSVKISSKEYSDRSLIIALAAIKYTLLKVDIRKKIVFNPDEALAFEGDTGPYLLYSYARANSISKKVKSSKPVRIVDLKDAEIRLLKKIDIFPNVVSKAYTDISPNLLANYSFELAQLFNEFYHECPVLGSIEEGFRLKLVEAFRKTLKKSLNLLGIDVLEEM